MFMKHALYFIKKQNDPLFEKERLMGEILRNTHSIEKGLSLENVKKGFGIKKIIEVESLIDRYNSIGGDINDIPIRMFTSSLYEYLNYHSMIGYYDSNIQKVHQIYEKLKETISTPYTGMGGVVCVRKNILSEEKLDTIRDLFLNRHSVREFDKTPVDMDNLRKAIELAMHCPSACNRQCYRVHIVNKSAFARLNNWMDGMGGFADDIDKLIIITGNISVYRMTELYQHVVTTSVFASYLTLSLQAYGIGCCFIQRDVIPNKKWCKIANEFNIPLNEEIVCCLGIGNLKDEYTVPISYRLPYETIVNEIYK